MDILDILRIAGPFILGPSPGPAVTGFDEAVGFDAAIPFDGAAVVSVLGPYRVDAAAAFMPGAAAGQAFVAGAARGQAFQPGAVAGQAKDQP